MDPGFRSASDLCAAIADREISSVELLDHLADRVARHDPSLNSVVALDLERARRRAAEADEATSRGESWGPMHGLPMTVKDVWETEGIVTTSGAPMYADHVPATDALAVARLKDAGAIVFGKTNSPLFAGDLQTFNEVYGVTNNPWDLTRTPGGSSGGAAAAVAAGLTPIELGSDIGGSIRNPAHCCGIYGFKPTWGVVPDRGHIPGPPGSLLAADVNCTGPLARTIDDLALLFGAVAGPVPEDAAGWQLSLPPASPRRGVGGLRIAYVDDDPDFPVSAEVRTTQRAFADRLADAGAIVVDAPMPVPMALAFDSWSQLVLPIIGGGLPDDDYEAMTSLEAVPGDDPMIVTGRALVSRYRDVRRADQRRQHQRAAWARHFSDHDVMLAPVMPLPAIRHDNERSMPERTIEIDGTTQPYTTLMSWCGVIGAVLLPVVAMPIGFTHDGLPVGVQVIGPSYADHDLLAISAEIDAVAGDVRRPPAYDD
jgi:amidase